MNGLVNVGCTGGNNLRNSPHIAGDIYRWGSHLDEGGLAGGLLYAVWG
jgi:hypothetical protein